MSHEASILLGDRTLDGLDQLAWKWTPGAATTTADFGNPTATTSYQLCIYDEHGGVPSLVMVASAPAGGSCFGKPCWRGTLRGFKYTDKVGTPDGLTSVRLSAGGAGPAKISVKGKGIDLPMPTLPLAKSPKVIVQLKGSNGQCWDADYSTTSFSRADLFKAKAD